MSACNICLALKLGEHDYLGLEVEQDEDSVAAAPPPCTSSDDAEELISELQKKIETFNAGMRKVI